MDRREQFIRQEVDSLRKTIQAAQDLLGQWEQNIRNEVWPAEMMPSLGTMQKNMNGIRRGVDTIEEILTDAN